MQRIAVDISPDTVLECFSKHLMAKIRPHWSKEKARIKKFEGGYSNYLIGLSQEGGDDSDIVLIRIDHAALSEFFADRDAEVTVMNSLHSSGWNPPVYCQFNNAICYGYAPGRPLSLDDLTNPVILGEIAKTMARYHSINIDIDGVDWVQTILQSLPVSLPDDEVSSAMVSTIGSWDYLMQEFKKAKATMVSFKSPLVLCHNDVHVLNMIYDEVHGKVTFIDHEAAGISHLAKEIGNFFRYFVGIFENLDFSRFPSEQVQKEFIRNYLKERHTLMTNGESSDGVSNIDDEVESIYIESLQAGPVSILLECLVLCAMIDKSRSKGLAEVASNIDFLKLQMDHYHHRKGIVESISK